MNGTNYEVPHCGVFSIAHSHPPWVQIFASGYCFQIPLACVPPLRENNWEQKFLMFSQSTNCFIFIPRFRHVICGLSYKWRVEKESDKTSKKKESDSSEFTSCSVLVHHGNGFCYHVEYYWFEYSCICFSFFSPCGDFIFSTGFIFHAIPRPK